MSNSRSRAWRGLLLPAVAALAFFGCDTSISSSLRGKETPELPPQVDGGSVAFRLDAQACIAIDVNTDSLRVLVKDPAGGILTQRSVVLSNAGISLDFPGIPAGPGRLVEVVGFDRFGNIHWYGAASVDVTAGGTAYARITLRRATGTIHVDIDLDTVDVDTTIEPPPPPPPAFDTIPVTVSDLPEGARSLVDLSAYRMGDKIVAKFAMVSWCQPTIAAYASPFELTIYPAPPVDLRLVVLDPATCSDRYAAAPQKTDGFFPEGTLGSTATVVSGKRPVAARMLIALPLTYYTVVIDLGVRYGKRDIVLSSANPNDAFRIELLRSDVEPCVGTYDANGVCKLPPPLPRCILKRDPNGLVVDSICPVILPFPQPKCTDDADCAPDTTVVVPGGPLIPIDPVYPTPNPIPAADTCRQVSDDVVICTRQMSPNGEATRCTTNADGVSVCEGWAAEEGTRPPPFPVILTSPLVK